MSKYFICSAGEPGKKYAAENLGQCILDSCFYIHTGSRQKGPLERIGPDDILILKFQHNLIAFGRTLSKVQYGGGNGWTIKIPVAGWIAGKATSTQGIQNAQVDGNNYQTVKQVEREYARQRIARIGVPV